MMHIVLVEPEIPQNTGNIARTCAATGAMLHLIEPLGFELSDKYLKRAGLDYWHMMTYRVYPDWESFLAQNSGAQMYFASTKAQKVYSDIEYPENAYFVFGRETRGLDERLLQANYTRCVRVPMREGARSLNLANSVAVVLFEALRQHGFEGLERSGRLREAEGEPWSDYV